MTTAGDGLLTYRHHENVCTELILCVLALYLCFFFFPFSSTYVQFFFFLYVSFFNFICLF